MADRDVDFLLIGGGVAAGSCALTLRREGAQGSILLVGRELDPPYHRPPVSKELLRGEHTREQTYLRSLAWWEQNAIEVLSRTSVMSLDTDARVATLSNRQTVGYDQALLATGAMVRRLAVEGSDLHGIHYLRTLGNAESLLGDLEGIESVALVGGSYIACEVAASLAARGKRCTLVMQESTTFERSFGRQAGVFLQGVLEEHGVAVEAEQTVVRFEPDPRTEEARVGRVVTAAGRQLDANAVVAGTGAVPDVMLARRSGLELGEGGGVLCDRYLRTSAPGVFAAGDMCEYDSVIHAQRMRIEHEDVACAQGCSAALNMLGQQRSHEVVPYFFSDLADWVSLEYIGPADTWDREVLRGSIEKRTFTLFYLRAGRVAAALTVGRPGDLDHARRMLASGLDVSGEISRLADENVELSEIAA